VPAVGREDVDDHFAAVVEFHAEEIIPVVAAELDREMQPVVRRLRGGVPQDHHVVPGAGVDVQDAVDVAVAYAQPAHILDAVTPPLLSVGAPPAGVSTPMHPTPANVGNCSPSPVTWTAPPPTSDTTT